jgi:hypothetical protein
MDLNKCGRERLSRHLPARIGDEYETPQLGKPVWAEIITKDLLNTKEPTDNYTETFSF